MKEKQNKAMLQMLLCAALWSTAGVMFKYIPWNSFVIAAGRGFVAGAFIFCYIKIKKLPIIINKRTLMTGVAMCLTCSFFVAANKLTTAANAIVLQFTSPIFVLIFSAIFFHKKFRRADVVAVVLTLAGMALFFLDELAPGYMLGNVVAIAAGCAMAFMFIFLGNVSMTERFSGILLCQIMIFLIGIPFALTTEVELKPLPIIMIVLLGVFQLGLPYTLLSKASEYCSPLVCSLLGAVEPLLNPVWVLIFYGEKPGFFALIGGVAVILTVTLWCVWCDRHPLPQTEESEVVENR